MFTEVHRPAPLNPHDQYADLSLMGGATGEGLDAAGFAAAQAQPVTGEAGSQNVGVPAPETFAAPVAENITGNQETQEPSRFQRFVAAAKTAGHMLLNNTLRYGEKQVKAASKAGDTYEPPSAKGSAKKIWKSTILQARAEQVGSDDPKYRDAEKLLKLGISAVKVGALAAQIYVKKAAK